MGKKISDGDKRGGAKGRREKVGSGMLHEIGGKGGGCLEARKASRGKGGGGGF